MISARAVKIWYRIHKWSSVICTAFLLMLCITGLPMVFDDELRQLSDRHVAAANLPVGAPYAKLDAMVAATLRHLPGQAIQSLSFDEDEPRVLITALRPGLKSDRSETLIFDAHTGRLLEEQNENSPQTWVDRMLVFATNLHITMFAGLGGSLFLGAMGTLFVISIVSGVLVYGPFMKRLDFGTVRATSGRRTQWFDLHNLLGIVSVTWMVCVGATGVMNTLARPLFDGWAAQTLPPLLAPYRGKSLPARLSSLDAAMATTSAAVPGSTITGVVFPTDPDPDDLTSPRHYILWTRGNTTLTKELFTPVLVDAQSGRLASTSGLPWYLRALEISRPLHFGDYGGVPLKIIWALFDFMTIGVLVSGVYLWLSRRKGPLEARLDELVREESGSRSIPAGIAS